ncbi:MAG: DUF1990 domain-containing protein [Blastocatellia bacterium]|nr:DUF1990 domain-containing protein [Blastocatellia bacterium]
MFLLKEPSEKTIRDFLASQSDRPFSYSEVGATSGKPPAGYTIDHNRVQLGEGAESFARAVEALRNWKMFQIDWVRLLWPYTPIETGETVGVLIRHYSLWSLNACRIVYTIDEAGPVHRYGFAYGTLPEHGERGEERFTVEWNRRDDSVWYDLLAFSRPNLFLAKAGRPLVRRLQKRFARDSKKAMVEAVRGER